MKRVPLVFNFKRDFAKWYLEKNDLDAILVSFFAENYEDWRYSLIRIDYKRETSKSGKIKISKELTPLRRYSYLVGKNEPNHTAKAQLSPLLLDVIFTFSILFKLFFIAQN